MKRLENIEIRQQMYKAGANVNKIAKTLGVHQTRISHLLQEPLSDKNKARIQEAIAIIEKEFEHEQKKEI